MAKPKTSFTELIHQAVREAAETLTIDQIVARVLDLSGGESTKNLKNTVRAAIGQSTAIIFTPEQGYGWKSRMINGVIQRVVIRDDDIAKLILEIDHLQRDLLQPNGPGDYKYGVKGTPRFELTGGPTLEVEPISSPFDNDPLRMPDAFGEWLDRQGARPGDSLLLSVIDADARRYGLSYEPAAARDEAAIAERGAQVVAAALGYMRRTRGQSTIWEMAGHLNVSGIFHQIPAPPPFGELWTFDVWGPLVDEYDASPVMIGGGGKVPIAYYDALLGGSPVDVFGLSGHAGEDEGPIITVGEHGSYQGDLGVDPQLLQARIDAILQSPDTRVPDDDPLLPAITTIFAALSLPSPTGHTYLASQLVELFGDEDEILDWIEHGAELGLVTIDPAYEAMLDEEFDTITALPSPEPHVGDCRTLVLRVAYRYKPEFWREIEVADDQLLSDLHLAIQRAFAWDNDHLYSFYMGKRPYDTKNEIGSPGADARRRADRVTLGELGLRTKQKFLYLFDFGDDHLFDIQVMKINPKAPPGMYPRVVGEHGGTLPQYEGEEDEDEDVWEE
ncbi:plasmid pRiA4b ORF-3 family protein [Chloroflexales bacterium ZM16-3]|nr:plasmid pRiA4b ORF-3 family protein [Chloroflexales bacterium ZM16-3]